MLHEQIEENPCLNCMLFLYLPMCYRSKYGLFYFILKIVDFFGFMWYNNKTKSNIKRRFLMKHLELLQTYLSNLAVLNIKFHNIHWNVIGGQFMQVHTFTEEIYDKLFEDLDEVAELLKMKNQVPLSTMAEYLEKATVEEVKAKEFSIKESLEITKEDLELMKKLATEIRNVADGEGDFETVAIFEDYVAHYSKNIWFVNSMLK